MSQVELLPPIPTDLSELNIDRERQIEPSATTVEELGNLALHEAIQTNEEQTHVTTEEPEVSVNDESAETNESDHSVDEIEAAHEAALIENGIFDEHVAAIDNAHAAALEENKAFDERKATLLLEEKKLVQTVPINTKKQIQSAAKSTDPRDNLQRQPSPMLGPSSQGQLRKEVLLAFEQAHVNSQIPPGSEITRDIDGNYIILGENTATVITDPTHGGIPKLTQYRYDKSSSKLTIGDSNLTALSLDQPTGYKSTTLKGWQTYREVVKIPPKIAKRFNIEQRAIKQPSIPPRERVPSYT